MSVFSICTEGTLTLLRLTLFDFGHTHVCKIKKEEVCREFILYTYP